MLTENNEDLTKKLDSKTRSLNEAMEQIAELKKAKKKWQDEYLKLLPAKRSAEVISPDGEKRSRIDRSWPTSSRG